MLTSDDIRKKYIAFFKERGHQEIPSASLIPENDPTTLFTGSGMQSMIPFLLGEQHPQGRRIVDSQKCFRAQDIEEVGDNRHTTFFEMLGNWSLGDYFKKDQIPWMYTFMTTVLGLDPQNLYFTCFRGNDALDIPKDEESALLWQELLTRSGHEALIVDCAEKNGMQKGKIFYYDETKNWWSRAGVPQNMPVGEPGGPDTEMFWDFGEHLGLHQKSTWKDQPCHVNCDCGRFTEIGNNVFMEYHKTAQGFEKLEQRNVDFGGGIERMATAVNNDPDMFRIDLFTGMRTLLETLSGKKYGEDTQETFAFRVIMDHLRAATFLIADGALPSNKDQGYFTRRLIRRAIRYGRLLNLPPDFTTRVSQTVIQTYADAYPQLSQQKENLYRALTEETDRFSKTLDQGLREFETMVRQSDGKEIPGSQAFHLFSTYGFPLEMTMELAHEKGYTVRQDDFQKEFQKHQETSRKGATQKFHGGLADHSPESTRLHTATHLLHMSLKKILGPEVEQKGSNITAERLRFDFNYPQKLTAEQRKAVEDMVNTQIARDLPVSFEDMPIDDAKNKGVIGLFEEKYGDRVRVYTVGDFSQEICGGPHVTHTGELGHFTITKEESCGAGLRRIKATVKANISRG